MNSTPVVGAVIVTYNRRDLLLECVRANLAQQQALDVIIIVDNASTDGTPETLESSGMFNIPRLHYHRLPSNVGGAGGFSFGLQKAVEAGCDWIWLMDDDAIPEADALEQLFEHLPETTKPPLLASQVVNRAGKPDVAHRTRLQHRPLRSNHVPASEYQQLTFEADAVSFVGPLVHRQHVEVCGLPRDDFFIYYDDFEYTHRIRNAGFQLIVVPLSRILHLDEGRSILDAVGERSWGWRMYYRTRNRVFWYRNIEPVLLSLWYRLLLMLIQQFGLILLLQPAKIYRTLLLLRAFADGWHGHLGKTINPESYRETKIRNREDK